MKFPLSACLLTAFAAGLLHGATESCIECHSALDGALQRPAVLYKDDFHARRGIFCSSCHGGDPRVDDPEASMSRAKGFLGKIPRAAVPKLCARCHSDATLMHKYNPKQRVDQYTQYLTSVHGKRMASGDTAAANCVDCHGVHNIRDVRNPVSPVHPLNLPETCARCHADAAHMARYKIPTNQYAEYRKSIHWEALEKRGDLSAPNCASCHGNHGATPPGVGSVTAVCGTCHVLMENLFRQSPHQPVFSSMGVAGCVVCHGNHAVRKPSSEMLAGANSVCTECHDATSTGSLAGAEMAALIGKLNAALRRSDTVLARASSSGMEVSEGLLRQNDGRDALVKARVAVHAFQVSAVRKPAEEGLKIVDETYRAGVEALAEKDRRRVGLGISLLTIFVTMAGLWVAIRAIEKSRRPEGQ